MGEEGEGGGDGEVSPPASPLGRSDRATSYLFFIFFLLLKTIKTIFCRNILEVVTYLLSKKEIARASGNWRQKRFHGSFVLHGN